MLCFVGARSGSIDLIYVFNFGGFVWLFCLLRNDLGVLAMLVFWVRRV